MIEGKTHLLGNHLIPTEVCKVDGFRINIRSVDHALSCVKACLEEKRSFYMCTMNLDHVVKLRLMEEFRRVYAMAWFITLDSMPLVWLKNLTGVGISKAAGSDIIIPICRLVAEQKLSVFLVGPEPNVNVQFLKSVRREFGGFEAFSHVTPSASFDPFSQEADDIIQLIAASNARLCLVGLGAPKQEIFSCRASQSVEGVGFIAVGAAIEFMAGTKRRAPKWMQRWGLEWSWRLAGDPRRLSGRYLQSFVALVRLIFVDVLQARISEP